MDDPYLNILSDQALEIFRDLKRKTKNDGLSDETVAVLASGVLEARQIMRFEGE